MVARITSGKSISGLINYNEIKVNKGDAELILASNFFTLNEKELSYAEKLDTFTLLTGKNKRIEKDTFHVSLNFDTSEKPEKEKLTEIAKAYMEKMGFGNQPFLVYQHNDVNHSHIHIVSVKVDQKGKKINEDFNKYKSEKARKEIEIDFNLIKASEKVKKDFYISPAQFKAEYGKFETKETISKIVRSVINDYKVTDIKEFQKVLSQFNIHAEKISSKDPEKPYEGLKYYITNNEGTKVSTGIKASSIYSSPTLQKLTPIFEENIDKKKDLKENTKNTISALLKDYSKISKEDLKSELGKKSISVFYSEGKEGTFGITFIDNKNKAVFSGSELGKEYSWNNLKNKIAEKTNNTAEEKHLLSSISSIYNQIRKEKYFFESTIIQDLWKIDLLNPILKSNPNLSKEQAEKAILNFSNFKNSKLSEIKTKEQGYFEEQVNKAFNFIDNSPARTQEKLKFLAQYQIKVIEKEGKIELSHSKGGMVKIEINKSLQSLLNTSEKVDLKAFNNTPIQPFLKNDKAFVEAILSGNIDLPNHSHYNSNYHHFRNLLSGSKQQEVEKQLAKNTISTILKELPKEKSVNDMIDTLAKRGLILNNKAGDYQVHYYKYPESNVPLSVKLNTYLTGINYQCKPIEVNEKYKMLSTLYLNLDKKDLMGSIKEIEKLNVVHPSLAQKVIKEVLPLVEAYKNDKTDKNNNAAIISIISSIEKNGEPNLKPQKEISEEKTKDKNKGVGVLTALLEGGEEDKSKAVKSHHSKNKKKTRRNI